MNAAWVCAGAVVALLSWGCASDEDTREAPVSNPRGVQGGTQVGNPASKNCTDKGGTLDMREGASGQYGVCKFSDGTECEEWAYFRDECKPGDQRTAPAPT